MMRRIGIVFAICFGIWSLTLEAQATDCPEGETWNYEESLCETPPSTTSTTVPVTTTSSSTTTTVPVVTPTPSSTTTIVATSTVPPSTATSTLPTPTLIPPIMQQRICDEALGRFVVDTYEGDKLTDRFVTNEVCFGDPVPVPQSVPAGELPETGPMDYAVPLMVVGVTLLVLGGLALWRSRDE